MKIEHIDVIPDRDSILWLAHNTENNEYRKEVSVYVADSCEALLITDSGSHVYLPSGNNPVAWAKYERLGNAIKKIIGAVHTSAFRLTFSLNEGIPFDDEEAGLTPRVNITCHCKCQIENSYKLYLEFNSPVQLRAEEIRNKLLSECQVVMSKNLENVRKDYTYRTINRATEKLSESIKKQTEGIFLRYGITLMGCNAEIFFTHSGRFENYAEERASAIARKAIGAKPESLKDSESAFTAEATQQAIKQLPRTESKCGRCGKVSPAGVRFCPVCGKKLN